MVLGKLPVSGRPINFDYSRGMAYCACSGCGWGLFGHFFSPSIISLFCLPLSWRRPDIDCKLSQRTVKPKTINQPTNSNDILLLIKNNYASLFKKKKHA